MQALYKCDSLNTQLHKTFLFSEQKTQLKDLQT